MLRQFYARRFLRIFPLYYAVIIAGRIIHLNGYTETFGWNLAYLTNFYIVMKGEWIGAASHLWTLSVEEQFYIVWPWVVFFLPKRWLLPTFLGIVVFAGRLPSGGILLARQWVTRLRLPRLTVLEQEHYWRWRSAGTVKAIRGYAARCA